MTTEASDSDRIVYDTSHSRFRKAFDDVAQCIALLPVWIPLSAKGIAGQHRRLFFGLAWVPMSAVIYTYLLGYVFSWIRGHEYLEFTVYLFGGYMCWQFIQGSVTGGFGLLTKNKAGILNSQLPFSYYVAKHVFELSVSFSLVFFFFLVARIVSTNESWTNFYMIIPAMILYLVTSAAATTFFSFVSIRFRDLEMPISTLMRIMFLFTPIIWMLEDREGSRRALFVMFNPFYHVLEILRAPLIGDTVEPINWIVSVSICITFCVLAAVAFVRYRSRITYWI